MTDNTNEQAAIRAKLGFPSVDVFIEKYAANVSKQGFFIKTASPRSVGSAIRFELRIEDGTTVLRGMGEVSWVRSVDENGRPAGMGVKFQKLDTASRDLVQRMLDLKKTRNITTHSRYSEAPAAMNEAVPPAAPAPMTAATAPSSEGSAASTPLQKKRRPADVNLDSVDSLLAGIAGDASALVKKRRRTSIAPPPPESSAAEKAAAEKAAAEKAAAEKAAAEKAAAEKAAAEKAATEKAAAEKAAAEKAAAEKAAAEKAAAEKAAAEKAAAEKAAAEKAAKSRSRGPQGAADLGKIEAEDHEIDDVISAFDDVQLFGDHPAPDPGGQIKITAAPVAGSMEFESFNPEEDSASPAPAIPTEKAAIASSASEVDDLSGLSLGEDDEDDIGLGELSTVLKRNQQKPEPPVVQATPEESADDGAFRFDDDEENDEETSEFVLPDATTDETATAEFRLPSSTPSFDGDFSHGDSFSDGEEIEEISVTEYDITDADSDFNSDNDFGDFQGLGVLEGSSDEDPAAEERGYSGFLDADEYVVEKDLRPSLPPASAARTMPDDEAVLEKQGWNRSSLFAADDTDAAEELKELSGINDDSELESLDEIEGSDVFVINEKSADPIDSLINRATQETRMPHSPASPLLAADDRLDSALDGIFEGGRVNHLASDSIPDELPDDALPANLAAHVSRRRSIAPPIAPHEKPGVGIYNTEHAGQHVSGASIPLPEAPPPPEAPKRKGLLGKIFGK